MGRWAHGARLSTLMPADASPISTVCLRLVSLETITTPSGCVVRVALRMLRHTGGGVPSQSALASYWSDHHHDRRSASGRRCTTGALASTGRCAVVPPAPSFGCFVSTTVPSYSCCASCAEWVINKTLYICLYLYLSYYQICVGCIGVQAPCWPNCERRAWSVGSSRVGSLHEAAPLSRAPTARQGAGPSHSHRATAGPPQPRAAPPRAVVDVGGSRRQPMLTRTSQGLRTSLLRVVRTRGTGQLASAAPRTVRTPHAYQPRAVCAPHAACRRGCMCPACAPYTRYVRRRTPRAAHISRCVPRMPYACTVAPQATTAG